MLLTQAMCFFNRLNKIKISYTLLFFHNSEKQKVNLIKNHIHVTERCQSSTLSPVKKNNRYPLTIGGLLLMLIPLTTFGLGTWQVKRKKWKEELIGMLKARTSAPPLITLPEDISELEDLEFRKFVVKGRYDHNNEVFIGPRSCLVDGGTPESGELISMSGKESYGYLVITPFVLSSTGQRILINRGWIKTKLKPQIKRPESLIQGEQTVVGVVRLKEKKNQIYAIKRSRQKTLVLQGY
uniref:SURF1-like protein n=1 Tax=Clastoptera arizonana TaxID=38151 RepID=A0A1B6EEY8_9HEMI